MEAPSTKGAGKISFIRKTPNKKEVSANASDSVMDISKQSIKTISKQSVKEADLSVQKSSSPERHTKTVFSDLSIPLARPPSLKTSISKKTDSKTNFPPFVKVHNATTTTSTTVSSSTTFSSSTTSSSTTTTPTITSETEELSTTTEKPEIVTSTRPPRPEPLVAEAPSASLKKDIDTNTKKTFVPIPDLDYDDFSSFSSSENDFRNSRKISDGRLDAKRRSSASDSLSRKIPAVRQFHSTTNKQVRHGVPALTIGIISDEIVASPLIGYYYEKQPFVGYEYESPVEFIAHH